MKTWTQLQAIFIYHITFQKLFWSYVRVSGMGGLSKGRINFWAGELGGRESDKNTIMSW